MGAYVKALNAPKGRVTLPDGRLQVPSTGFATRFCFLPGRIRINPEFEEAL